MKSFVIFCIIGLSLAAADVYKQKFSEFKKEFGKQYETAEEEMKRFNIFKANSKEVLEHNRNQHTYTRGINFFSDLLKKNSKAPALDSRDFQSHLQPQTSQQHPNLSKIFPTQLTG